MKEITNRSTGPAGWEVVTSIVYELNVVLEAVRGYAMGVKMPDAFVSVLRGIPPEWLDELDRIIKDGGRQNLAVFETLGFLAGVLQEEDYSLATLPMRNITLDSVIEKLKAEFSSLVIEPNPSLSREEQFVDLGWQGLKALYRQEGLEFEEGSSHMHQIQSDYKFVLRLLEKDDLYSRFWFWIDRFYFGCYQPWRQSRLDVIQTQKEMALLELGALKNDAVSPALDWLPSQNCLKLFPGLQRNVTEGRLRVLFLAEPFGLPDMWSLFPGRVITVFNQPGVIYENFVAYVHNVASRTSALSDPTRLVILRLIRHFGLVNTEIARYLGLARPTVSVHVKILRDAGLIRSEQEGREMRHRVVPSEIRRLFRDLENLLDLPDED